MIISTQLNFIKVTLQSGFRVILYLYRLVMKTDLNAYK